MTEKKPLIIVTGPTAVGKTAISIQLAKAIQGEIISADSIQVYRHMDIGSAKITKEEMNGIPHFLIDEKYPDEEFHIFLFQKMAQKYIKEIYSRGHIPILVGGTGFYIQSVLYEIEFCESDTDKTYRKKLEQIVKEKGNEYLHECLQKVDPKSAASIHPHNIKRVIRALEYYRQTQTPISEHNEEQQKKHSPYQFAYFVLNRNRNDLYKRIDQRVDSMMELGFVEEVKTLLEMGYTRDLVSMQGLGYKELAAYLCGDFSLNEAVERIKRNTRHFAKRQLTWFRREKDVIWMDLDQSHTKENLLKEMLKILEKRGMMKV